MYFKYKQQEYSYLCMQAAGGFTHSPLLFILKKNDYYTDLKLIFRTLITVFPPFPGGLICHCINSYFTSYTVCRLGWWVRSKVFCSSENMIGIWFISTQPPFHYTPTYIASVLRVRGIWWSFGKRLYLFKSPPVSAAYNISIWAYSSAVYFPLNID